MDTCSDSGGRGRRWGRSGAGRTASGAAGARAGAGTRGGRDRDRRLARRPGPTAAALGLFLAAAAGAPGLRGEASAQTFLTQDEALRLAFPEPAAVERHTAYLDEDQLERVRALAGAETEVRQTVVTYYVGRRDGKPLGTAYFDAHRVRTLPEVLMFVVSPSGRLERIEILKFREPPEYAASERWLDQLEGRGLGPGLSLKGDIINLTGATLTSRAVTGAARRVLALHRVIDPLSSGSPGAGRTGGSR